MSMNETAKMACAQLQGRGHQAYIVGGACRDLLLGRNPKDFDIVTSALPNEVEATFPRSFGVGKAFGIVNVLLEGDTLEIATFRLDSSNYSDGRRPDSVEFTGSYEEDAKRRDLTMNAIYHDPVTGEFHDPVGGKADIESEAIRFIGNPDDRMGEDRLRALRAIRFAAQLGFGIEERSWEALMKLGHSEDPFGHASGGVSWERIRDEFMKIICSKYPVRGIMLLKETGFLHHIVPEYDNMWACHQSKRWHEEGSAGTHSMLVLSHCQSKDLVDRLACFFHDIGKPRALQIKPLEPRAVRKITYTDDEGDMTLNGCQAFLGREEAFDQGNSEHKDPNKYLISSCDGWKYTNKGHDILGAKITEDVLLRFKLPTKVIEEVTYAVQNHMNAHTLESWKKTWKVRRFLGHKYFPATYRLAIADEFGSVSKEPYVSLKLFVDKMNLAYPEMLPKPIVTGDTLIKKGLKPGERFVEILAEAYNHQLDGWSDEAILKRIPRT